MCRTRHFSRHNQEIKTVVYLFIFFYVVLTQTSLSKDLISNRILRNEATAGRFVNV